MKTKIVATVVVIAAALSACGEDKVTNNDPQVVRGARTASMCHGYYASLISYIDDNGNVFDDTNNLRAITEKLDEVYQDALDDFLDEGAITDKIIEADIEKADTAFSASLLDAKAMYDGANSTCAKNIATILSPRDVDKLVKSIKEEE